MFSGLLGALIVYDQRNKWLRRMVSQKQLTLTPYRSYGLPANIEGKLKHWRGVSGIFGLGGPWMLGFGKLIGCLINGSG
jgi:hypothetical protein